MEDPGNFGIHVDHHVFFSLELFVSLLDSFLDPVGELGTGKRVDNVGYIGAWELSIDKFC